MSNGIDPQELANTLAELDVPLTYRRELIEKLGLPEPIIRQTMIVTLHIPVVNLDPMGDTYTMGIETIRDIVEAGNRRPLSKPTMLTKYVDTVEIALRDE